jgi:hypothetical protein
MGKIAFLRNAICSGRECFLLEAAGLTIRPALVSGRSFYPWACHEVNAKAMLKAGV